MKKKILYIHGYGSNGNSRTATTLQNELGDNYKVFSPTFSNKVELFTETLKNIEQAEMFIKENSIQLLVASSMGAFIALHILDSSLPKLLINPCMRASEQIPIRIAPSIDRQEVEKYSLFENEFVVGEDCKETTFGVFSDSDELFSYQDLFIQQYFAEHSYTINDNHRISIENIKDVLVPFVRNLFK